MIIRRATFRLTMLNSAVMLGVLALVALGVNAYVSLAFSVELPETSEELADHAIATLRVGLFVGCGALALMVPFMSYLLARRSLAPVRANLEAQQRFVDDASHELRTPIAVAQGELELALLRPRSGEDYRAAIEASLVALEDLGGLTSDLLLLSQSASEATLASGAPARTARITMAQLTDRAIRSLPPQARERVTIASEGSGEIAGLPDLLVRAVANLLENAAKFSRPDSAIELRTERAGDLIRISVTDEGPGMSAEDLRRAFDRFWRADRARSTPGRGIGLSIVRRVADYHGGRVTLVSEAGVGTRATLELPVS